MTVVLARDSMSSANIVNVDNDKKNLCIYQEITSGNSTSEHFKLFERRYVKIKWHKDI